MKKLAIFLLGGLLALFLFTGTASAEDVYLVKGSGYITCDEGNKVIVYPQAIVKNDLNYGTRLAFKFVLPKNGGVVASQVVEKDKYGNVFSIDAHEEKPLYPMFVFPKAVFEQADNLGKMAVSPVGKPPTLRKIQGNELLLDSPNFTDQPVHLVLGAKKVKGVMTRKVLTTCHIKNPNNTPVGVKLFVSIRSKETGEVLCQDRFRAYHNETIEAGDTKHVSVSSYFPEKFFGVGYIYVEIEEWNFCL